MQRGNIKQKVRGLDATMRAHLVGHEQREDKLDPILKYVRNISEMKSDIRDLKEHMDRLKRLESSRRA